MILRSRRYDQHRWAVWRWSDVVLDGTTYLLRLHLLKTPMGALMLHRIYRPDPQRDPHDHPVAFLSLVLRGGYVEHRGLRRNSARRIRWFNYLRTTDVHRIVDVAPGTLTLCFAGPKPVGWEWGHYVRADWVGWREYQAGDRSGSST